MGLRGLILRHRGRDSGGRVELSVELGVMSRTTVKSPIIGRACDRRDHNLIRARRRCEGRI